jgi:hypothetical protein
MMAYYFSERLMLLQCVKHIVAMHNTDNNQVPYIRGPMAYDMCIFAYDVAWGIYKYVYFI